MIRKVRSVALGLAVALAAIASMPGAQDAPRRASPAGTVVPAAPTAAAGRVWVVTLSQGDAIWERFGHNFLAVENAATGRAVAYNWGVFDFASPDFTTRFVAGDPRYWMEGVDLALLVAHYEQTGRGITLQELAFSPAQAADLATFLAWNAREENRYYRYDYFLDNCSTRLRDAIDRALGGALKRALQPRLTNSTYRSESTRLTSGDGLAPIGIAFALGQPADRLLSAWEAAFVPMRLRASLRDVTVRDATGADVPLVRDERVIAPPREVEAARAPSFLAELGLTGLVLAGIFVALGRSAAWGSRSALRGLVALGTLWSVVAGVMGTILVLAWTTTPHVFWFRNENLFHFDPLSLGLLALLPLAGRRSAALRRAAVVATIIAGLSALGAVLELTPWMRQENWAFVFLALPVHLALAWALRAVLHRRVATATPGSRTFAGREQPGNRRQA